MRNGWPNFRKAFVFHFRHGWNQSLNRIYACYRNVCTFCIPWAKKTLFALPLKPQDWNCNLPEIVWGLPEIIQSMITCFSTFSKPAIGSFSGGLWFPLSTNTAPTLIEIIFLSYICSWQTCELPLSMEQCSQWSFSSVKRACFSPFPRDNHLLHHKCKLK